MVIIVKAEMIIQKQFIPRIRMAKAKKVGQNGLLSNIQPTTKQNTKEFSNRQKGISKKGTWPRRPCFELTQVKLKWIFEFVNFQVTIPSFEPQTYSNSGDIFDRR